MTKFLWCGHMADFILFSAGGQYPDFHGFQDQNDSDLYYAWLRAHRGLRKLLCWSSIWNPHEVSEFWTGFPDHIEVGNPERSGWWYSNHVIFNFIDKHSLLVMSDKEEFTSICNMMQKMHEYWMKKLRILFDDQNDDRFSPETEMRLAELEREQGYDPKRLTWPESQGHTTNVCINPYIIQNG